MRARPFPTALLCSLLALGGAAAAEPLEVPACRAVVREVTDVEDFTGRLEAVLNVEIRARVSGHLLETPFKEGSEVKKGDVLFVIDPRPYQAEVDRSEADVRRAEARLARLKEEAGKTAADRDEAAANLQSARAGLDIARLNLAFTKVLSPIDGRIGRRLVDPGNLVSADETVLARIVSEDPVHAYFDLDERSYLRIRKATDEGKVKPPRDGVRVLMGLPGEEGYPREGTINFVDNQVNPATGAVTVRATFANPRPAGGQRLLLPGMFARIRLPMGPPYKALLVPDKAIGSDEGIKFVYVIDADNKVQYRRVSTGPLQAGGLRVIAEGLKPDDLVAVGKLKELRARMAVQANVVAVPVEAPAPVKPPGEENKK